MKNTAPRVGVAGGAGGRRTRPPRRAQGRKPRAGHTQSPRPARDKKCVQNAGARAGGQGGKPRRAGDEGKRPAPLLAKHRASRKKTREATPLCRAKREPRRGVPSGAAAAPAAGARQGQPPPRGGKAHTTRRAIMLRQTAMAAKDNRQQGNEKGGSPQRQDQSGSNDAGHRAAGERSRPKKPTPTT